MNSLADADTRFHLEPDRIEVVGKAFQISTQHGKASEKLSCEIGGQVRNAPAAALSISLNEVAGEARMSIVLDPEWTNRLERRFLELAEKHALGTLSANEREEFGNLQRFRRRHVAPRSAKEIQRQLQRDKLLREMEELLSRYVQFEEADSER